MSSLRNGSVRVTITVETVDSGAQLLRQTIVVDGTSVFEQKYYDSLYVAEISSGLRPAERAQKLRQSLANFVMWIGGFAAVLLAAASIISSLVNPISAIAAAGLSGAILRSVIRTAGQIAGVSELAK